VHHDLQRGNDTWANPVPYDKLGVRYRRWRNTVASGDMEGGRAIASSASMSAGQLFSPEDPIDEKEGAQQLQSAQQV
jgi:chlorophyllide a oxygenase